MKNLIIPILLLLISCNHSVQTKKSSAKIKTTEISQSKKTEVVIKLSINKPSKKKVIGNIIDFNFKTSIKQNPDSIIIAENQQLKTLILNPENTIQWNSQNGKTGNNNISIAFYWGDTLQARANKNITLYSDITPEYFTYKLVKKWKHNTKWYTQGLEFSDDYLYEGTGQYGESTLNKMDLDSEEVLQSTNLNNDVFGEGITIFEDKIYQLTWRSSIGFVYDKESFKKLYDFNYPTEGWGLTNNGKELIMSDGSEKIYFLDTEFLQETKQLEVYDNEGPVMHLNELEYINGLIYANIYGTENIVAFDEHSGKVIKIINLTGILNKSSVKHPIDVLNGIAWDNTKKRLIVTGKWWPYYYHIELIKK